MFGRILAVLRGGLSPLSGAGAKAPTEAGVEEAQMIEPALLRDINDLGITIPQKGYRLEQSHFHSQSGNRKAEILVKEAIQMAAAASETVGKLRD